jgi:6-phosphogluconolactonase (cycloisomerase 2 family)
MQHKLIIKFIFVLFSILISAHSNAQTHTLVQGWNLEGNDNGAAVDPNAIFGNATTPTTVSQNVTTVWAWDKIAGIWNFFAPSMTPSALSAYAATKGYGVLTTIQQGQGFWINAKNAVSVNLAATSAAATYTIGGTVTGLTGSLVLQNNGVDNLIVSGNGSFQFASALANGNTYNVSTQSLQLPNQVCSLTGGSGTATTNINSVAVNCVKYTTPLYAYTANTGDNSVSTFSVDSTTGRLTFIGNVSAGLTPKSVTVDPSGKFVYVANQDTSAKSWTDSSISQYTIGLNGSLIPMSPAEVATGADPYTIIVDPTGKYAYATNETDNTVSQYTIGAGGGLTPMTPAKVATGKSPYSITIDPSGKYAYVANSQDGTISQYIVGSGGGLIPMSTATVATVSNPYTISVDPLGKYAYGGGTKFAIGGDGSLSFIGNGIGGGLLTITAIDPTGKYFYQTNMNTDTVSQYTIGLNGVRTAMTPATVATGSGPVSIIVDPSGQFVYVSNFGSTGSISQYSIGAGGALIPLSPATVSATVLFPGYFPYSIAISAGAPLN